MGSGSWDYWTEIGWGFVDAVLLLVTGYPDTWAIIRQSLLISVSATLASLALGVPLGVWLANTKFAGRGVLLAICNTGFGLPPVVVGLILSILLLRHGPLGADHRSAAADRGPSHPQGPLRRGAPHGRCGAPGGGDRGAGSGPGARPARGR